MTLLVEPSGQMSRKEKNLDGIGVLVYFLNKVSPKGQKYCRCDVIKRALATDEHRKSECVTNLARSRGCRESPPTTETSNNSNNNSNNNVKSPSTASLPSKLSAAKVTRKRRMETEILGGTICNSVVPMDMSMIMDNAHAGIRAGIWNKSSK